MAWWGFKPEPLAYCLQSAQCDLIDNPMHCGRAEPSGGGRRARLVAAPCGWRVARQAGAGCTMCMSAASMPNADALLVEIFHCMRVAT